MSSSRPDARTVSLEHAAALMGIGRSTAYRLYHEGNFPVVVLKIGRQLKVPRAALECYVRSEEKEADEPTDVRSSGTLGTSAGMAEPRRRVVELEFVEEGGDDARPLWRLRSAVLGTDGKWHALVPEVGPRQPLDLLSPALDAVVRFLVWEQRRLDGDNES